MEIGPNLLLDRVLETLSRYNMLAGVRRLGVAVSGGSDSVCLLIVLHRLAQPLNIELRVVHVNHKLRGADSDWDAASVRNLADRLGLPFLEREIDVRALGGNLEQTGRDARRRFFSDLIEAGTVDRVATAHTRSDQAETVLFRLLRGSGTAGLCGVLPVTSDGIVRPFINVTKDDVLLFLQHTNVSWREDSTNFDTAFVRNRIRHQLLPLLSQEYSPAVTGILAATADIARDEEAFWTNYIGEIARRVFTLRDGGGLVAATADLLSHGPAVARRLVRSAISRVKGDLRSVDILHVEGILSMCRDSEGSGRLQVPGVDVMRSFAWVRFGPLRSESRQQRDYSFDVRLDSGAQRIPLPRQQSEVVLELRHMPEAEGSYNQEKDRLDFKRLTPPLQLRNWHPGDQIHVPGRGPQKLKSLFQEVRVPLWERQGWPLLTAGGEVAWARRFGVDARYRIEEASRPCLYVTETRTPAQAFP